MWFPRYALSRTTVSASDLLVTGIERCRATSFWIGEFGPDRWVGCLTLLGAHTGSAIAATGSDAEWNTISLLNSPINLDVLDDYLMSDRAPDDSMGLSDLDGFLTGVVVGPELIMPSEWLPVIWGGAEPQFETQDEMRIVLGTIMGRYNEIAACFASDPEEFDPIFWEGPEGEVIASDWAGGFLDAIALRAQAWKPLIEDDRAGHSAGPFVPAQRRHRVRRWCGRRG